MSYRSRTDSVAPEFNSGPATWRHPALLRFAAIAGVAAWTAALSAQAHAQTTRYVSSTGNNANNCSLEAPCLTLQRGINRTPIGGELKVLDSGAYADNPATITRSITISADSVSATIRGVTIDGPDAVVVLRGLLMNGTVPGTGGIPVGVNILAAKAVHIVRSEIQHFAIHGVHFNCECADPVKLHVTDSIVRNNGGNGLSINGGNTFLPTVVTVENSRIHDNASVGVAIAGNNVYSVIRNTMVSGSGTGIAQTGGVMQINATTAFNNTTGYSVTDAGQLALDSAVATGNRAFALTVASGATARMSNVTIVRNGTGIQNSGTVLSLQNNMVSGNAANAAGNPITPLAAF
jgi:hypothetical protein